MRDLDAASRSPKVRWRTASAPGASGRALIPPGPTASEGPTLIALHTDVVDMITIQRRVQGDAVIPAVVRASDCRVDGMPGFGVEREAVRHRFALRV